MFRNLTPLTRVIEEQLYMEKKEQKFILLSHSRIL